MKEIKKRLTAALIALAATVTSSAPAVFAEGSKELVQSEATDAYRPYLEWRDRVQMGDVQSKSVVYAYANAGETIYFGSSVKKTNNLKTIEAITYSGTYDSSRNSGVKSKEDVDAGFAEKIGSNEGSTIAVTLPVSADEKDKAYDPTDKTPAFVNGSEIGNYTDYGAEKVFLFKPDENNTGYIENVGQEKNGPNGVGGTTEGYKPFSFTAPVTGTYAFRFLSSDFIYSDAAILDAPSETEPAADTLKRTITFEELYQGKKDSYTVGKSIAQDCYRVVSGSNMKVYKNNDGYSLSMGNASSSSTPTSNNIFAFYPYHKNGTDASIKITWHKEDGSRTLNVVQGSKSLIYGPVNENGVKQTALFNLVDSSEPVYIYSTDGKYYIDLIEYYYDTPVNYVETAEAPTENVSADEASLDSADDIVTLSASSTTIPIEVPEVSKEADWVFDNATVDNKLTSVANDQSLYIVSGSIDTANKDIKAAYGYNKRYKIGANANYLTFKAKYKGTVTVKFEAENTSNKVAINSSVSGAGEGKGKLVEFSTSVDADKEVRITRAQSSNVFIYEVEYVPDSSATTEPTGGSTEAPAVSTEAPAVSTEAPAVSTEAPAVSTEAPVVSTEAPVADNAAVINSSANGTKTTWTFGINGDATEVSGSTASAKNYLSLDGSTVVKESNYSGYSYRLGKDSGAINFTPSATGLVEVYFTASQSNSSVKLGLKQNDELLATAESTSDSALTVLKARVRKNSAVTIVNMGEDADISGCVYYVTYGDSIYPTSSLESFLGTSGATKIGDQWRNTGSTVAAWDVTVAKDNKAINGRVWADMLFMNAGAHKKSIYSKLYILTKDGFEYLYDLNGMQPYSFAFYSNNRGFLIDRKDADGNVVTQPLMHSFFSREEKGSDVASPPTRPETDAYGNPLMQGEGENATQVVSETDMNYIPHTDQDFTHKIFFNVPDNSGDTSAVKAYTNNGLISDDNKLLSDTSKMTITPVYKGKGNTAGEIDGIGYGNTGVGGEFTFTIKTSGDSDGDPTKGVYAIDEAVLARLAGSAYCITLDFSGYKLENKKPVIENGKWAKETGEKSDAEKNNIVILSATLVNAEEHKYTVTWDGKDNYGNNVPAGVYGSNDSSSSTVVASYIEGGTVHFPLADVERTPNGVKVTMLNDIALSDKSDKTKIYYNNEAEASSWYFKTVGKGVKSPSKIGDGKNATTGIDTANEKEEAMVMGDYSDADKDTMNVSDNESAYGNFCAIDMWTQYTTELLTSFQIGVKDSNVTDSAAVVSFVAKNGTVSNGTAPFEKSHISVTGGSKVNYAGNKGNDDYGNTISTGFVSSYKPDASVQGITWEISVPASTADTPTSYVKLNNTDLTSTNAWYGLTGNTNSEGETYGPVIGNDGATLNSGSIYKVVKANGFKLAFKMPFETTVSSGTNVVFGVVLDNIYAPGATAKTTYLSGEDYNKLSVDDYDTLSLAEGNSTAFKSTSIDEFRKYMNGDNNIYKIGSGGVNEADEYWDPVTFDSEEDQSESFHEDNSDVTENPTMTGADSISSDFEADDPYESFGED